MNPFTDEYYMKKALDEAHVALTEGEIPVGAVIVCNNQIIGKGHNQVEKLNDISSHAEMIAITAASNYLSSKYLEKCKIYVTLEPCAMCATAISLSHITEIIYGTADPKRGFSLYLPSIFPAKTKLRKGVMQQECSELLLHFFKSKRS